MAYTKSDVISRLIDHLLGNSLLDDDALDQLIDAIAGSPSAVVELAELRGVLTAQDSQLKEKLDELISIYQFLTESDMSPPCHVDFGQWYQRQTVRPRFWQQQRQDAARLTYEIQIWIKENCAKFVDLPDLFTPQLVPVGAHRSKDSTYESSEGYEFVEVLELPDPDGDLLIQVGMEPASDGSGALIVKVSTLTQSQPIAYASVTLRDGAGGLLEINSTDGDGLVTFSNLEDGKYIVRIQHEGATHEFSIVIRSEF